VILTFHHFVSERNSNLLATPCQQHNVSYTYNNNYVYLRATLTPVTYC